MKVFLSSTYLDLIEHRKAVVQALRTMDEEVGHMEIFGARDEEATTVSLEELDKCDVLVGVYAYRYGTIPPDSKASVTEQEYLHAMSKKIPVLIFVVDESHPWPPKSMDKSLTKVKKFKSKATREHSPEYFTSPDNLASKVLSSIGRLAKKVEPKLIPASPSLISYSPPKPKGSTLPAQPYFFGRENELAIIADAISPESRTWGALIDGPGGIGKTALAVEAAHQAPKVTFEHKFFITAKVRELTSSGEKPLTDFTRPNYLEMLNELAIDLGEDRIPRLAPEERTKELWNAMRGKKVLVVYDNLETLHEDERTRLFQFLSRLPEGNKAIVTSRRRADVDARVIRLDRLSLSEALQLIEELAKNNPRLAREEEKARRDLYEITNGNPLLIKWVCGQLGRESSAMYTVAEAYEFIESAPKGNDPLEYIFGDLLETFTESETKVLAALTHFTKPAKLKWIAEITGLVEQAADTALEDLTDRAILVSNSEAREFFLPSLAAQFIRNRRPEAVNHIGDELADRAHALAVQYGGHANYDGFKALEIEWTSIAAALPRLLREENDRFQDICSSLFEFLNFAGLWDELLWLTQQAEEKALIVGEKRVAGWRAYQAGSVYYFRSQSSEVLACATRAKQYWQHAPVREKASAIHLQGLGYMLMDNYLEAINAGREALELDKSISSESEDVAADLNYLANAESQAGNYEAAELDYKESLRIAKKLGDQEMITVSTGNLADLALDRQLWSKAAVFAHKALTQAEVIARKEIIAYYSVVLGSALINQNKPKDAIPYIHRAIEIFSKIRDGNLAWAQEVLAEGEAVLHKKKQRKAKK